MAWLLKTTAIGVVLCCIGLGIAFGIKEWTAREDRKVAAEAARNHAVPAWCVAKLNGVEDVCWRTRAECNERKLPCEEVSAYSCFLWTQVTTKERSSVCMKTYGQCVKIRARVVAEPEATDIADCLVYRTAEP